MGKTNNGKRMAGIFETHNGNVAFFLEDFKLVLTRSEFSKEKTIIKADESGYIWGITFNRETIAVYSNKDIEMGNCILLHIEKYIIFEDVIDKDSPLELRGIRFTNGAIRTIYPCNGMDRVWENENQSAEETGIIKFRLKEDGKEYFSKQENETIHWKFYSTVKYTCLCDEGPSLSNGDSRLDIVFDSDQNCNIFKRYYQYVEKLCSFLTFRKNVSFESICLLRNGWQGNLESFADCYVKYPDNLDKRESIEVINIHRITEGVFDKILKNIEGEEIKIKKKKLIGKLPFTIIPKDDGDARSMSGGKISSICAALEKELELNKICTKQSNEIEELVEQVKEVIKKHRERDCALPEKVCDTSMQKTYDKIFRDLSYWKAPLADRIWEGWTKHEPEIEPLCKFWGIEMTQEKIDKFVKTRNVIAHSGTDKIDSDIALTGWLLLTLIYCCTLTRLEMDSNEIKDIISRGLI